MPSLWPYRRAGLETALRRATVRVQIWVFGGSVGLLKVEELDDLFRQFELKLFFALGKLL